MTTNERYRVRVTKDHLVFSAAHFITFNGNVCERLHGHNWRVAVEVSGSLDENSYVFDFIALRDETQKLVNQLDHRVLLPVANTTAELIAHWLAVQLKEVFAKHPGGRTVERLQVDVEENFGQWAICEMDLAC